jgi:hypothetical protein
VPVVDGEPGVECQIDFARMGMLTDAEKGRRRWCEHSGSSRSAVNGHLPRAHTSRYTWRLVAHSSAAKENRSGLQNLVGLLEISVLTLQRLDPLLLGCRDTRSVLGIDLGLQHPLTQGLRTDPDLRTDRLRAGYTDRYSPR